MKELTIELLRANLEISYVISILINIIISILAFIPSIFLTAANILVFGFWEGTLLSLVGEVIGSLVSFYLYRKGIRRILPIQSYKNKYLQRLYSAKGIQAFLLIVALRLFPFVPSGLVNIGAAFGKVSSLVFGLATIIGKIPSLLMEAFAVSNYLSWEGDGKYVSTIIGIILIGGYLIWGIFKRRNKSEK